MLFQCWECDNETVNWHPNKNWPCTILVNFISIFPWRIHVIANFFIPTQESVSLMIWKCFTDDLCAINDGGEFGGSFCDICPNELEYTVQHQGDHGTFLNLNII